MLHGTVDATGIQKSCSVIDVRSTRRNSYKQLTILTTISIFESKLGAWIHDRHAPPCLFGLSFTAEAIGSTLIEHLKMQKAGQQKNLTM